MVTSMCWKQKDEKCGSSGSLPQGLGCILASAQDMLNPIGLW